MSLVKITKGTFLVFIVGLTLAKECMISDRTSESGSVPIDFMRASHMKCHIWVRYSGPRTCAHSSSRGIDSAAATRTLDKVQEKYHFVMTIYKRCPHVYYFCQGDYVVLCVSICMLVKKTKNKLMDFFFKLGKMYHRAVILVMFQIPEGPGQ